MYDSKLIERDVAAEVLSTYKGQKIKALIAEMQKPQEQRNQAAITGLWKELRKLSHERMLMYKGDEKTIRKIYNVYSPRVKQNTQMLQKATSKTR